MSFVGIPVVDFNTKLYSDFPQFFDDTFWGIECSSGWFDIIYPLCEKLATLKLADSFRITQIKEKYGDLRIYVSVSHPEADALISEAEKTSSTTCEVCGAPNAGHSTFHGRVRTLCGACYKARQPIPESLRV